MKCVIGHSYEYAKKDLPEAKTVMNIKYFAKIISKSNEEYELRKSSQHMLSEVMIF